MIDEKFVILSALLNLYGTINYTYLTLKGRVKPNRVTFFLWALAPLVAFAAQLDKDVGLRALMTFMVGFGPLMVLAASFISKQAAWELKRFDFICGGLSILGLLLWALTRDGNYGIFFAILADGLAAIPTVVKAYKAPETESALLYFLAAISAGVTILTIDKWNFANWGFPIYILFICLLISSLTHFKLGQRFSRKLAR